MLTPQEIKNQEFKVKFRGYEVIQVNAYLQRLSEFLLTLTNQISKQTNQISKQANEIVDLKEELKSLALEKEALAEEMKTIQNNHIEDRNKEKKIKLGEDTVTKAQHLVEIEKLRTKIAVLEEINNTLRQEELDFKTTITAAQSFSHSLKEASEAEAAKLKETSEAEAARLKEASEAEAAKLKAMSEARAVELKETSEAEMVEQIEKLRTKKDNFKKQSEEERSQLLTEINKLKNQKEHVKGELKDTLHFYLNALDDGASKESVVSIKQVEAI